ncbi:MAG TPA: GatB/YqeY domain-containing protein [Candidatus Saccharimonadales bacterium]|nr:GatB/YqeY domain-containing protein [Candidatus Saccharimonadales bacterium]
MLEQTIEQDLKAALLSGDSLKSETLRGLKATLLNVKIADGKRESGLSDEEIFVHLGKQSKQRQESADLYQQGGDQARADKELSEKAIIDEYLPEQISEDELSKLIDQAIIDTGVHEISAMGNVIGQVKQQAGASADGAIIARMVKEKLK